ncbi:MAG: glycerol-3-phosphate 1-O-acyltransferase PlsY [Synergistaceae bacterium]|nr:glycerol-3-phosphate 1-O-acyltransferase PlsY [Synergistaceae bacterium]
MTILHACFWIFLAYMAGSMPTGYVVAKIFAKQDIREFGSKNIGATNISRLMGKSWGIFVSLTDMLKGGLVVLLASHFVDSVILLATIGVASVFGHNYPVWLSFKGGKGVSTTFGVVAFYNFFNLWVALYAGVVWFLVMFVTGYVSIASIIAIASMAFFAWHFNMPLPYIWAIIFLTLLTIIRHKENLIRVSKGTELKVNIRLFK